MSNYFEGFEKDVKEFEKLEPIQPDVICKDVSDWSDEWYKSILPENNKLILGFEMWDKEFKGKLRSK